jgi:hypothetical protein
MRNLLPVAGNLLLLACASSGGRSEAARESCEVTDLGTVFQDPLRYDKRMFCGEVIAYAEGPTIKMFPLSHHPEAPRNDLVLLPDLRSEKLLPPDVTDTGVKVYVRGRLDPMRECFNLEPKPGHMCVPYRRPIVIRIRDAEPASR